MKAMILEKLQNLQEHPTPLKLEEWRIPSPKEGELLIQVSTCGVCHTEIDIIEGRTPPGVLPMILGHQVVGRVCELGSGSSRFQIGDRVGIGWFFNSCGKCEYCLNGNENLCAEFRATGRDAFGGYAEMMVAPESSIFSIPFELSDSETAPLLCAGAIGNRSLRLSGLKNGQRLGLTGFGASAHLVMKTVQHLFPHVKIYVFSRRQEERDFAIELGATWAGKIEDTSPEKLDCIIDTTPAWKPIIESLRNLAPGGRLVINAIRKEDVDKKLLLELDYPTHLWMEKEIKSVANVSKRDISEFLQFAALLKIKPEYQEYALEDANKALMELKSGKIRGAKVLRIY